MGHKWTTPERLGLAFTVITAVAGAGLALAAPTKLHNAGYGLLAFAALLFVSFVAYEVGRWSLSRSAHEASPAGINIANAQAVTVYHGADSAPPVASTPGEAQGAAQPLFAAAFPFVSGNLPWATADELAAPVIQERRVRLVDLPRDHDNWVSDKRLVDCELVGPAIIALQDATCLGTAFGVFGNDIESILWPFNPNTVWRVGVIPIRRSRITGGRTFDVGIAGSPEGLDYIRENLLPKDAAE